MGGGRRRRHMVVGWTLISSFFVYMYDLRLQCMECARRPASEGARGGENDFLWIKNMDTGRKRSARSAMNWLFGR